MTDPALYSPLSLAYLGDAVHELLIRTQVISQGNRPARKLSADGIRQARAAAQSRLYYSIEGILTEEELAVMKRGRNANPRSRAKNASVTDYRRATGVEALFGYLYLQGKTDRINELYNLSFIQNGVQP
jgi:ribonuclease-3 family protein